MNIEVDVDCRVDCAACGAVLEADHTWTTDPITKKTKLIIEAKPCDNCEDSDK